jgi:hypothetical protein
MASMDGETLTDRELNLLGSVSECGVGSHCVQLGHL